jgi:hypothetical protein
MTDLAMPAARRNPAVATLLWVLKTAALWFIILVAGAVAGTLVPVHLPPPIADGPLTVMQAFLAVNGLIAVALALVASIARVRGWKLAMLLFIAYFMIGVGMMQIETLWFNDSLKLPLEAIAALVAEGAIVAAIASIAAALLFWPERAEAQPVPANLTKRIAIMAIAYVFIYYSFGAVLAWSSPAVRAYYENGIHIAFVPTVLFQVFRGTLWAIIALFIVSRLNGSLARRALVMGVLFSVLTAAQLLYPTPFFPWAVRAAHLAEVGSSEFVYGVLATLVLVAGASKRPLAPSSLWRLVAGPA